MRHASGVALAKSLALISLFAVALIAAHGTHALAVGAEEKQRQQQRPRHHQLLRRAEPGGDPDEGGDDDGDDDVPVGPASIAATPAQQAALELASVFGKLELDFIDPRAFQRQGPGTPAAAGMLDTWAGTLMAGEIAFTVASKAELPINGSRHDYLSWARWVTLSFLYFLALARLIPERRWSVRATPFDTAQRQ
jgi:hypothetical protein